MGAVPALVLASGTWSPPDVLGVRGYSGQRPRRVRQPQLSMTKNLIRSDIRKARQAFVLQRSSSTFIPNPDALRRLDDVIAKARLVAGYLPVGSEADLRALMTSYAEKGTKWCLPWLSGRDAPMHFRAWQPGDVTNIAPGGFAQPHSSSAIVKPDVILLPLLGFDRTGNRLGQGAGHYDRALEHMPHAVRIGVGWSVQEVELLPYDPWDMPLDAILTEAEWIVPPHSRLERA